MKIWKFKDIELTIIESEFDYDLHWFKCYKGDVYLGGIYPSSIKEMNDMIEALNRGENPITEGWEDGLGNICTLEGWVS